MPTSPLPVARLENETPQSIRLHNLLIRGRAVHTTLQSSTCCESTPSPPATDMRQQMPSRDLVWFAFCSACQEQHLGQFNFCWKCGVQPSDLCRPRGIPSGPRSLWMSKKSRHTKYWRKWKGTRSNYEKELRQR